MTSDFTEKEEAKVMFLQNPSETSKDKRPETWGEVKQAGCDWRSGACWDERLYLEKPDSA